MLWSLGSSGKKSGVHVTPTRLLNEIWEGLAINFIWWIHHFKDKVSSHLFGRLEQAVTIRRSIFFMLQLLSHSRVTTQLTFHSVSPWPPPGLLNYWTLWIPCTSLATWAYGYFPFWKYIVYTIGFLCDEMCMACFWVHPARFNLNFRFEIFCILVPDTFKT